MATRKLETMCLKGKRWMITVRSDDVAVGELTEFPWEVRTPEKKRVDRRAKAGLTCTLPLKSVADDATQLSAIGPLWKKPEGFRW